MGLQGKYNKPTRKRTCISLSRNLLSRHFPDSHTPCFGFSLLIVTFNPSVWFSGATKTVIPYKSGSPQT